ncbi:hypothetical protein CkP1_0024 [Citrobacter phage CkP1]|nr:hypothetical protein CkP1_0024 [Citrobacter phage CkP1]
MKLNPLPWIKEWLAQPDEFWKVMNDFSEECENQHEDAAIRTIREDRTNRNEDIISQMIREELKRTQLKEVEAMADSYLGGKIS